MINHCQFCRGAQCYIGGGKGGSHKSAFHVCAQKLNLSPRCTWNAAQTLVLFALPVSVPAPLSPLPVPLCPAPWFYFYSLCLSGSLCLSDHWLPVLPAALISAATQSVLNFCMWRRQLQLQRGAPCVAPSAAPHKSCSRRAATVASVSKQCAQSPPKTSESGCGNTPHTLTLPPPLGANLIEAFLLLLLFAGAYYIFLFVFALLLVLLDF